MKFNSILLIILSSTYRTQYLHSEVRQLRSVLIWDVEWIVATVRNFEGEQCFLHSLPKEITQPEEIPPREELHGSRLPIRLISKRGVRRSSACWPWSMQKLAPTLSISRTTEVWLMSGMCAPFKASDRREVMDWGRSVCPRILWLSTNGTWGRTRSKLKVATDLEHPGHVDYLQVL